MKLPLITTLLIFAGFSTLSNAAPFYVGGHIGRTTIDDDKYFDLISSKSSFEDFAGNFDINAGINLNESWQVGIDIGKHGRFKAHTASDTLSLKNSFARIHLKYNFVLPKNLRWYLKGGLGFAKIEQSYANTSTVKKTEKDTAHSPSLALGIQKGFFYFDEKYQVYVEWQYSGYNLKTDSSTYNIKQNELNLGLQWIF